MGAHPQADDSRIADYVLQRFQLGKVGVGVKTGEREGVGVYLLHLLRRRIGKIGLAVHVDTQVVEPRRPVPVS